MFQKIWYTYSIKIYFPFQDTKAGKCFENQAATANHVIMSGLNIQVKPNIQSLLLTLFYHPSCVRL